MPTILNMNYLIFVQIFMTHPWKRNFFMFVFGLTNVVEACNMKVNTIQKNNLDVRFNTLIDQIEI